MMVDILKGVITRGTGSGLALNNGMPCAGKTGTTDNSKDGWFCGFTKYYTTAVWVGYDSPKSMYGLYGATYPGRIWKQYMNEIHEGLPVEDWDKYQTTGKKKDSTEEYDATEAATTEKATESTEDEDDNIEEVTEKDPVVTEAPIVTEAPVQQTEAPVQQETPQQTEAPVQQTEAPVQQTQQPVQQQTPVEQETPQQ